ncbi:MAG: redoxin domain-containing protein [Pirellulales bacterium]
MKASLLVWASCALAAVTTNSLAAAELKPGDEAPDFALKGSDGKTYSLDDFKGKKAVVIAWFPKAFTGGCTKECQSMRADGKGLRKYQVAYFTASVDEPHKYKEFAESLGLDFPILSDPDKSVAKEYGVLRANGGVANRWTFYIGKDGKVLYVDKDVKAAEHGKDIAKKLEELGIEKK